VGDFVSDTHALYWYLAGMPQLSQPAKDCFDEAARGGARLLIPTIVLAELYYLNSKLGAPLDFAAEYGRLIAAPQITFVPFGAEDVLAFQSLSAIPEMHDRIIAGVALSRACPCITRDPAITASGLVKTSGRHSGPPAFHAPPPHSLQWPYRRGVRDSGRFDAE